MAISLVEDCLVPPPLGPPHQPWGASQQGKPIDAGETFRRLDEEQIYFDTMVLSGCAKTYLTDLLRTAFAGRLHILDGVKAEVTWGQTVPGAGNGRLANVFNPPPWFKVERLVTDAERKFVLDLQQGWALAKNEAFDKYKNKGEAETLVHARGTHWLFITNDGGALAYDGYDHLAVRTMAYVFSKVISDGLITEQELWDAYSEMINAYSFFPIWTDGLTPDNAGRQNLCRGVKARDRLRQRAANPTTAR